MRKFALIGYPLGHTMSPPIHQRLFELSNNPASYEVCEISPDMLPDKISDIFGFCGVNVTIPHKISVIPYLNSLDETAKRYGAVNVIDCKTRCGYNTDVYGFTRAITGLGANLTEKTLLIGSGGAGRMMAIETAFSGGELTIAVRESDIDTANKLKEEIKDKTGKDVYITEISRISGNYDLLLNATPVGMHPKIDSCPVSEDIIKNVKYVFDAIYNPKETLLIKTAKKYNIPAGGGMAMLVHQAVAAHEIWDNAKYKTDDINKLIYDMSILVEKQGQ